jgi:DNA repair protein RadC
MADPGGHKGEGHRSRLRERFFAGGLDGFHDYEVVELLLTLGTPRKDCKETAKAALRRFKSLQGVFEASGPELEEIPGIGSKNSFGIRLVKAAADRYFRSRVQEGKTLGTAGEVREYLKCSIGNRPRECFMVIFLNAKNRVLDTQILFEGTLTASAVYPREVVRAALGHHAASLIFVHNHPSGDPSPSRADMNITRRLIFACRVMDLTVHEHLIVGRDGYYSFAEQGHIARMDSEAKIR